MVGFVIKNQVIKGSGLGRKELGFATAKVDFFTDKKVVLGCYRSKILIDGELYLGITNISFNNYYISETHILRFNQNIYDKEIEITLLSYFRGPMIAKSIKDSRAIIESDIRRFWDEKSCRGCTFCLEKEYGYSNYTVEGTDYVCMLESFNGFRPKYDGQNAHICSFFKEGESWHIDVDRQNPEPTEEWIQAEYRDLILNKLINE